MSMATSHLPQAQVSHRITPANVQQAHRHPLGGSGTCATLHFSRTSAAAELFEANRYHTRDTSEEKTQSHITPDDIISHLSDVRAAASDVTPPAETRTGEGRLVRLRRGWYLRLGGPLSLRHRPAVSTFG